MIFRRFLVWAKICSLAVWISACGAFADAAGPDPKQPDGDPTLTIHPTEIIRQGQTKEFAISFIEPPPWVNEPDAKGYLTDFDAGGDDIEYVTEYDGVWTIQATLRTTHWAATGERVLKITAAFEDFGETQQSHSGWGLLYVLPRKDTDEALDGGDNSRHGDEI